jgi:hypothetical protein
MQNEDAFARLTQPLDPYQELLQCGQVAAQVEDAEQWQAELERQASRDRLDVDIFVLGHTPDGLHKVFARQRSLSGFDQDMEAVALNQLQRDAELRASIRGHQINWLRTSRGEEAAGSCTRCHARLYVSRLETPPTIDGEALDQNCPHGPAQPPWPPQHS